MPIFTFSEFLKLNEQLSKPVVDRDISEERDELMKQVVELVGGASESGLLIQIGDIVTDFGKVVVKVLINGIENDIELEDGLMKVNSPNGGFLDGVKGSSDKLLNILQGVGDSKLSEM
jgi:hypothetical protein